MNIRKYIAVFGILGLFAFLPVSSFAATFLVGDESNEDVSAPSNIDDDVYAFGNIVDVTGGAGQDVVAGGQMVAIGGIINGDVYAGGQTIDIAGLILDDVHVGGETVTVSGQIAGDFFAGGQSIKIDDKTTIGGDTYIGGQFISLAGEYTGTVRVAGEDIKVLDGTVIHGDLITYGNTQPSIGSSVVVEGETKHVKQDQKIAQEVKKNVLVTWVRRIVSLFALALVFVYLLKKYSERVVESVRVNPGKSILIGAVLMVLFMPVILLLLITTIGIPLALVIFFLTLSLFFIATGFAALFIGSFVMNRIVRDKKKQPLGWPHALVGAVIY